MTREEQIIEKAGKESELFYNVNDNYGDCFHGGFIAGARWADEHPQFDKKAFMEKACWWLRETAHFYVSDFTGELDDNGLLEDFKRAMEE